MNYLEAKYALCRELNIKWSEIQASTQELFNWEDLDSWINLAGLEAWDYAPWILKEKSYTVDSGTVASQEYYDYPDDFVNDSIFLLRVQNSDGDMETYKKVRYLDYIKVREEDDEDDEALWSDHNRWYFINPNTWDNASGRTLEIWGILRWTQLTASDALLPFSPNSDNEENSGNHAIIRLAYSYALDSEKLDNPQKAERERGKAYQSLEILAKRERERQADYEVYDRPLFEYKRLF